MTIEIRTPQLGQLGQTVADATSARDPLSQSLGRHHRRDPPALGRGIAHRLAERGMALVLTGRNEGSIGRDGEASP